MPRKTPKRRRPADTLPTESSSSRSSRPHLPHDRSAAVYAFSRDALRRLDRLAVEEFSLPTCVLMENAAAQLFSCVLASRSDDAQQHTPPPGVLILSGPGNNGGDGLALACLLDNASIPTAILLSAPPTPAERFAPDTRIQLNIVRAMGLRLTVANDEEPQSTFDQLFRELGTPSSPPIIVDCLLGTGLNRPIESTSLLATLIARINHARTLGATVIAADVPSGLDADTGKPLGPANAPAVRAHTTVSFVGMKLGYTASTAREYLGEIMIADIGAPRRLIARLGTPLTNKALFSTSPLPASTPLKRPRTPD